tara:strand:+ start:422 stop:685 length:264 start_codon:yes stop_codon:yes gene_type:complete
MALTEASQNDKIEVVISGNYDWCSVHVRKATAISRDGVEISKAYHRHVVVPDGDVSAEDADVQAICNAVFTQECKDGYATWKSANII